MIWIFFILYIIIIFHFIMSSSNWNNYITTYQCIYAMSLSCIINCLGVTYLYHGISVIRCILFWNPPSVGFTLLFS